MTLIVGAGLCGLRLAGQIEDCRILEKSRGVGGRMATRRAAKARFDHGAQFYALKTPLIDLHRDWSAAGLVQEWWGEDAVARFACPDGMTGLAKHLAKNLDIQLEAKALRLNSHGEKWEVEIENRAPQWADRLILTCPLPQSLELLRASRLAYDKALEEVTYAKALVALLAEVSGDSFLPESGYREGNGAVLSVADQARKGLCADSAWTVTMSPEFSATHFAMQDHALVSRIEREILSLSPRLKWQNLQLKRWRYSHPLQTQGRGFAKIAPGLYLCGDGFTSGSLNGAAESATQLLSELTRET